MKMNLLGPSLLVAPPSRGLLLLLPLPLLLQLLRGPFLPPLLSTALGERQYIERPQLIKDLFWSGYFIVGVFKEWALLNKLGRFKQHTGMP